MNSPTQYVLVRIAFEPVPDDILYPRFRNVREFASETLEGAVSQALDWNAELRRAEPEKDHGELLIERLVNGTEWEPVDLSGML